MIEPRSHIPIIHVPKPKNAKKRIASVSPKMKKLKREYHRLRDKFLKDHPYCQHWLAENNLPEFQGASFWIGCPKSTEIHHKKGRGRFYLDTSTWMAVSREAHLAIHTDPEQSYSKGYMLPRR